jgi:small subunit ribosomal protein S20
MPVSKSAKKRVRVAKTKEKRNKIAKENLKNAIKQFEEAVENEKLEAAQESLKEAKQVIDKSVNKGIIHENNAARKKSKLDRKFNSLSE